MEFRLIPLKSKMLLDVPYDQKEFAKTLGAKWDGKSWYAPFDSQLTLIYSWLPVFVPAPSPPKPVLTLEQAWEVLKPQLPPLASSMTIRDAWQVLPPRTKDPKELLKLLGKRPIKVSAGFCAMCDSRVSDEWCIDERGNELFHMTDLGYGGLLRPSEYKLLVEALDAGTV